MAARFLRALFLLLALAFPAAAQEDDQGFLTRTLQSLLSDAGREVTIRGFQGALSSRATMRELSIADAEGPWLILSDVVLDWDRSALFSRRVEVNELSAARIEVLRAPVTDAPGMDLPSATARRPFALPQLPVSISIGRVNAETVFLGAPILGEEAEFRIDGSAQLEGGQGQARLEAVRIDGGEGLFRLAGSFDNTSRHLSLDLTLAEGPGGIAARLIGIPGYPSIQLTARGDDPIAAFRADISLATDGEERVAGEVTFLDTEPEAGLLDGAVFRLDIGGDLRPLLIPSLHDFFGAESRLTAQGTRTADGTISLPELRVETRALTLNGRADLAPDGMPRLIDIRLDVAGEGGERVVLPGTDGAGLLREAALAVRYDAAQGPDWTVLGRLTALGLPQLEVAEMVLDARGRLGALNGAGPLFDGVFEFAATGIAASDPALQAALGPAIHGMVSLNAPGGGEPLQIAGMALEGETISLSGHGTLSGFAFDGFVEFEAPDLAPFSGLARRDLGGAALVQARGQVDAFSGALDLVAGLATTDLSIGIPEADNLLAGRAAIDVSVRRDTEGTTLRLLTVQAGTLALGAQGTIVPGASEVNARLRLSDLARLGAGYGGTLGLDLSLREVDEARVVTLDGEIGDLALGDRPGAAQVAALLAGRTRLQGRITERGGVAAIDTLTLTGARVALAAEGTVSQSAQDLVLRLDRLSLAPLAVGVTGTVAGTASFTGRPQGQRVAVDLASLGALRTGVRPVDALLAQGLRLAATGAAAGGELVLEAARLTGQGLDVQAQGRQGADGAIVLTLDGGLEGIGRLIPGLDGAARLTGRLGRPPGDGDIDANLTLTGPSQLSLTAQGRISPQGRLAMTLSGGVEAGIANPLIAPATVQGQITAQGTVNGPPALDSLRLAVRLSDGRYVLPGVGVAFGGISGQADLTGTRARVALGGESLRGGGVQVEGTLDLGARPSADLTATATRFRIVRPRLFDGSVSGTVRLTGPLSGPTVSGQIGIDEVEIRIPNSPLGRGGFVPEGLRHTGESAASRQTRLRAGIGAAQMREAGDRGTPIYLDLTLDAPGRVFVRGRGLDAELGGTLRLSGSTRDTIPSGAFTLIRGRLDLLGNRFVLTDGSASLLGSFEPVVRLVATTESGGVVTSVILEGPAIEPEIRFESVPELPQDEVLARLLFGRGLASLSPFQAAQLGMSVATLTGRSESSIFDRTRRALGLDDLDFSTDAEGNTAVRAGRYLGERVYADVGVNSAGRSEVTIQLDLSPSLTVRGRADSEGRSSVGIFFERDY